MVLNHPAAPLLLPAPNGGLAWPCLALLEAGAARAATSGRQAVAI